jgi:hypothetical protein
MPEPINLEAWILDALSDADTPMDFVGVCQFIWENHEPDLRAAGRKFFRWQLDAQHALTRLKRQGLIRRSPAVQNRLVWEISGDMTNPFEAMCRLANHENWCWNLFCTTCGQQDFRYGLVQIANSRHPASSDWDRFGIRERSDLEFLSTRSIEPWPAPLRRHLADILSAASLQNLAQQCSHPSWIGYLGVALHFAEQDEQVSRRFADSWLKQLRRMVDPQSSSQRKLDEILSNERCLTWMDLNGLEFDIARA